MAGMKILIGLRSIIPINILSVFLFALLFNSTYSLYSQINYVPNHVDEIYWMQSTYFYHLFFQKKDLSNKDWNSYISFDHPPIGKYILGFSLRAGGQNVAATNGGIKEWFRYVLSNYFVAQFPEKSAKLKLPEDKKMLAYSSLLLGQVKDHVKETSFKFEALMAGRRTMFFFGILSIILLVAVGASAYKDLFIGLLAGMIFLDNKITVPAFQQVLIDSICCFFVLSALLALFWLFRELSSMKVLTKKIVHLSVLEGVLLSLALGTKFITMYMVVAVMLVFIAYMIFVSVKARKIKDRLFAGRMASLFGSLGIIFISAFDLFVLLNPFLYRHPIGNTLIMFKHRVSFMHLQASVQSEAIHSFSDRISTIFSKGILLGYPFPNMVAQLLYLGSFILGGWVIIKRSVGELFRGTFGAPTIVLLWTLTTFIVNGAIVNMEWDRYYIPFAMCTALIVALGSAQALAFLGVNIRGFSDGRK